MEKPRPSTHRKRAELFAICGLLGSLSALVPAQMQAALSLSDAEALRIGKKIWQNECRGTIAGLTSWNEGENFASLGIGHFIWYPEGVRGPFDESFPKFLSFATDHRANLPGWLLQARACPWNSRTEFSRAKDSLTMKELRQFLATTVDLQAQFMVARLQNALAKMLEEAGPADRANVERQFGRLASTPNGRYALVDYDNFKGEGVLATERYRGEGWGLLQVLEGMRGTNNNASAVQEFSRSAAEILTRRVQNSPPDRKESRWLPGWLNRVNSYGGNS
jgi:hypothetical protein